MSSNQTQALLTPAARQMLKELTQDFSEQLLLVAQNEALRATGDIREITVADLARSYARVHRYQAPRQQSRFDVMLRLYSLVGVLTAAVAVALFVVRLLPSLPSVDWQLLVVAISGLSIALLPYVYQRYARAKQLLRAHRYYEGARVREADVAFLSLWSDLEVVLRSASARLLGESVANAPISTLLTELAGAGVITSTDVSTIRKLLDLRNRVAHFGAAVSDDELPAARAAVNHLVDRLQRQAR